jgi:hypothetical protein
MIPHGEPDVTALLERSEPSGQNRLLYHRSGLLYRAGDRIQPGNWGRVILGAGPPHNRFYAEYLLDRVRSEFSEKPSRMEACFAFENFDAARAWSRGPAEYVYAVRLADSASPRHRGDMDWIDALPLYRTFDGVEECARRYWAGHERGMKWEIVVAGELVVVDRLTAIAENGAR